MSLTYTDKNLKTVLHSWGRFRVRLMEAVQPGDALSWYNSATYTVQEAAESDSQRADCFACEEGDIAETIWAALAVELKSASTVGTGGVVTRIYFADSGDDMGSPLYLGDNGKPSSTAGTTYPQIIGHVLARDRIILNVTGSATGPTFSTTITPATDGGSALGTGSLAWSDLFLDTLGVINFDNGNFTITHTADTLTFSAAVVLETDLEVAGTIGIPSGGSLIAQSGSTVVLAGGLAVYETCTLHSGVSIAGATTLQTVIVSATLGVAGKLTFGSKVSGTNLPSSDPGVAGELWSNSNVINRSTGT